MRIPPISLPRQHRRAILIFILTIVVPVCVLLWLGIQSFDRQRLALETLRREQLAVAIEARTRESAEAAFRVSNGSFARHFFTMEAGELVRPALHSPIPGPLPSGFLEAERHETRRPAFALTAYRRLAADPSQTPLALHRIARTLSAGRSVLVTRPREFERPSESWWVPLDSRAPRKLSDFVGTPTVHVDGASIAFSLANEEPRRFDLWVMEGFLPRTAMTGQHR